MAYARHEFEDGDLLTAQIMNEIEDGIVQLDKKINIQKTKNLLVLGDSMFGSADGKYFLTKFCDEHNLGLKNWAASGSTFGYCEDDKGNERINILTTWRTNTTQEEGNEENFIGDFVPDFILIDGGGNDYFLRSEDLLTIDTNGDEPTGIYNRAEAVFKEVSEKFPFAKKFFLIIHRVTQVLVGYLATGNEEKYIKQWDDTNPLPLRDTTKTITFPQISNELKNISNKYGFKCIDVYNNSFLTGVYEKDIELLPVWIVDEKLQKKFGRKLAFQRKNGIPLLDTLDFTNAYTEEIERTLINLDFLEWEGIHPKNLGYEIGYKPNLESAFNLISNTEKNFFDIKYFHQTTDNDIVTTKEINADNINGDFPLFLCGFTDGSNQIIYASNIGFHPSNNEGANTHSRILEGTNFKGDLYYIAPGGRTVEDLPTSMPNKNDFMEGLKECIEVRINNDDSISDTIDYDKSVLISDAINYKENDTRIRVSINVENVTGNINIIFKKNPTIPS